MPETSPTPLGWIALAAFVIGLLVRTVKSDGMKVALANLGLPPIPTRALPWVALFFGAAGAMLDAKVAGSTWEAAAQAGITATALAVLGHELGSGLPGVKKVLGFVLVVGFAAHLSACAWLQSKGPSLADLLFDKSTCILPRLDKPAEVILQECFADAAKDDVPKILELIAAQKSDRAAVRASEQHRASTLHCAPSDAGVQP